MSPSIEEEKRKLRLNRFKPFKSPQLELLDLSILFSLDGQNVFFECVDLCTDKPIVIIKPTVAIARLLSLGLKLYISILVSRATGLTLDQETTGSGDENGIQATCSACSTKISLDICRVYLKYAKVEHARPAKPCWQSDLVIYLRLVHIRFGYTRPFPKSSLGETAWNRLALGFGHFRVCGYTPFISTRL